jgi:quinol monooxygenase YgiN
MGLLKNLHRRTMLALVFAATAPFAGVAAAADGPQTLVVAYVETPPSAAAAAERSLKAYADDLRKSAAAPTVEVLHEVGRPQRMAVIERWPADATPADGAIQKLLDGRLQAPVDRRPHKPVGPLLSRGGAFHMLMHVDVVPAGAEMATKALDALRTSVLAAPGALGYELAVQPDRANHFAIHETWASRAAYEAWTAGKDAQALRAQLATVKGALFDDRFYVAAGQGK